MSLIIKTENCIEDRWGKLLKNSIHASYRASYSYVRLRLDKEFDTFVFVIDGIDVAGSHYSLKKFLSGMINISEIEGGIVFKTKPDRDLINYIIKHFLDWSEKRKVSYARISPWLPQSIDGNPTEYFTLVSEEMSNSCFSPCQDGRHTYWIDLTLPENQLFLNADKETRNRIRSGTKSGMELEWKKVYSNTDFNIFWNLYNTRGHNKKFRIIGKERMQSIVATLLNTGEGSLVFTLFNGRIVYASLVSAFGDTSGLYSALDYDYKNIKGCPPPGQFTYWAIYNEFKKQGLKIYDLGFCPGPIPNKSHPSYNIWRFKYRFGGLHVQFLPIYGKKLKPLTGRIFELVKYH
jgi:lipid II:glycine glycyltransferase (peptidoglycan interpeptide bridge formation enzyme)